MKKFYHALTDTMIDVSDQEYAIRKLIQQAYNAGERQGKADVIKAIGGIKFKIEEIDSSRMSDVERNALVSDLVKAGLYTVNI